MYIRNKILYCLLVATCLLLLLSCSTINSTNTVSVWKDPNFSTPIKKVLIIGIHRNLEERRLYENTLVKLFKNKGVNSISSVAILPSDEMLTRETVSSAIKGKGFDAVLVTRVIGKETDTQFVPVRRNIPIRGYRRNLYDFYHRSYPIVNAPGYYVSDTMISLETNLYSTKNSSLVWSIQSESFNPINITDVVEEVSESILYNLEKESLISKK